MGLLPLGHSTDRNGCHKQPPVIHHLQLIDYVVVFIYLTSIMGTGLWRARRQKTSAQYFTANRRVPAWAVAFTLMATVISSASFVAHPGAVFTKNLYLLPAHIGLPVILLFVAYFLVPFYRRVVGMSSYEYFGRRFGYGARLYASSGFVVMRILDLGITLYTASIAIEVMTGWPMGGVVVAVGMTTMLYTMAGGIEAVIWTDVVQGFILIGGMILIATLLLFLPAGGPAAVLSTASVNGKFALGNRDLSWQSLFEPEATAWIWLIAGFMILSQSYTIDQNIVQRYLLARSDRQAQRGVLIGGLVCLPVWITFMVIGACLWSFYRLTGEALPPEVIARPDNILPYFVATQLPAGVVGLLLAAILAAAQSTISADLNSISTVVTTDYFAYFLPRSSEVARLTCGRIVVLVCGVTVTTTALLLVNSRAVSAAETGIMLATMVAGGVLGLFALGFFTEGATTQGAYIGIATCMLFTGWATLTGPLKVDLGFNYTLNRLLIGVASQPVLFASGYLASLALRNDERDIKHLTIWGLIGRGKQNKGAETSDASGESAGR
jgi:SSS family solute:Na+ symporter